MLKILAGIALLLLTAMLSAASAGAASWRQMSPDQRYDYIVIWQKQHCLGLKDPGRAAGRDYVSQARTFEEFYANVEQYCRNK